MASIAAAAVASHLGSAVATEIQASLMKSTGLDAFHIANIVMFVVKLCVFAFVIFKTISREVGFDKYPFLF